MFCIMEGKSRDQLPDSYAPIAALDDSFMTASVKSEDLEDLCEDFVLLWKIASCLLNLSDF